ncbi:hypothetical protein [Clostridium botulinum]|uniref:hypothetical protein n=1 Tax=Clostridium botulinum TaxID=1491 RepID=UPI0006A450CA|nr:hypothetical protein [Clostridium botulinum]KOC50001.1 hypothetical protein ADU88_04210 [Clostridium botulinum]
MLKIKINEKEYDVTTCYENTVWTGEEREKTILVTVANTEEKDYFDNLVGTNINAEILSNGKHALTINKEYVFAETYRNIAIPEGSFNVRFKKILSKA